MTVENVLLIFSNKKVGSVLGIAKMMGQPDPSYQPRCLEGFKQMLLRQNKKTSLMPNFKVEWLMKCQYPYSELTFLPQNPMNVGQPVYQSNSCQEVS